MSVPLKVKRLISTRAEVSARCADTEEKKANTNAKLLHRAIRGQPCDGVEHCCTEVSCVN